jgi:adenylyltransferase/sulfurtransferase
MQVTDALKILLNSDALDRSYRTFDVWNNTFDKVEIAQNPDCPCCGQKHFEYLDVPPQGSVSLCGRDAYQINTESYVNLEKLAEYIERNGTIKLNKFMLVFESGKFASFTLFPDGRAIVKNVKSAEAALSVYSEYIGV